MTTVLGQLLPLAVGVAISPLPIIAAILMLFGDRARATSLAFTVGWVSGIVAVTILFVFLGSVASGDGDRSPVTAWIQIGLGAVLLLVGLRQWRGRSGEHSTPKWMAAIDETAPLAGAGIGFALAAINPKNLVMCAAAGVAIGSGQLTSSQSAIAVAVFAVLAAATVAVPVLAFQVASDRLRAPLDRLKQWLQENNATVVAVLILVIATVLLGKGISGL